MTMRDGDFSSPDAPRGTGGPKCKYVITGKCTETSKNTYNKDFYTVKNKLDQ